MSTLPIKKLKKLSSLSVKFLQVVHLKTLNSLVLKSSTAIINFDYTQRMCNILDYKKIITNSKYYD